MGWINDINCYLLTYSIRWPQLVATRRRSKFESCAGITGFSFVGGMHNCLVVCAPKIPLGVCRKKNGLVSRIRVSVCHQYVHSSDEKSRWLQQPIIKCYQLIAWCNALSTDNGLRGTALWLLKCFHMVFLLLNIWIPKQLILNSQCPFTHFNTIENASQCLSSKNVP